MNETPTRHLVGTPTIASKALPALKLVQSSLIARRIAKAIFALLLVALLATVIAPWQQTARGTGQVVAYVPQEREQTITSPIKGVIAQIADGVVEGTRVEQGQFILEVQPNAANLVEQKKAQMLDLQAKLATEQIKQDVYGRNVVDYTDARDYAVAAAQQLVEAAEAKVSAKQNLVPGYEAKALQASLNYQRQQGLFEKGIKSQKEVEKMKKDWDVAKSDLESALKDVTTATKELAAKKSELEQKRSEAETKIDYSRAMQQGAIGQAATIQKEIRDLEIYLEELARLVINAPRTGTIFRMSVFERGQAVKEGDPLFTIVPDTTERAVELWISGNDVPLIRVDDPVRLQFEGWPAVQWVGWPSAAVGTFGGRVVSIDATDNGKGNFRLLVKPAGPQEWPSDRFLRQGVRANGWVMLSRVTLGYEIWRQLNGFPPVISPNEPGGKLDKVKAKKVKLPK